MPQNRSERVNLLPTYRASLPERRSTARMSPVILATCTSIDCLKMPGIQRIRVIIHHSCVSRDWHTQRLVSQSTFFTDRPKQFKVASFVGQLLPPDLSCDSTRVSSDRGFLSREFPNFGAHRSRYDGQADHCRYTDLARREMPPLYVSSISVP